MSVYHVNCYGQGGYPLQPVGQGYPPQGQVYPPQGQGYPPQGQGYPPQGQGYPPQGQGYPPQQAGQGYPPQYAGQGGYPPQGQGYPPQAAAGAAGQSSQNPKYPPLPAPTGPPADDEVMDNAAVNEPVPSAPPLEKMDAIPGYNNLGFDTANYLPPPSYDEAKASQPPREQRPQSSLRALTVEEAQSALLEHASSECCWGTSPAKGMVILDIKHVPVFHYTLETFGESRSTTWTCEPYQGGLIDSPANGMAPAPWAIPMSPPTMFFNILESMEVPHTASIKPCHDCYGMGRKQCHQCRGRGWLLCHQCHNYGHGHGHDCKSCNGNMRSKCHTCQTSGMIQCKTCQGLAYLKCYIKLTVKWTNHKEDKVQEGCYLPPERIQKVSGDVVFKEEHPMVWPVNHFPDQRINNASKALVEKHRTAFPAERMVRQRHRVQIVPIAELQYQWKGKYDVFWVYGHEKLVYAPTYPSQCCCGCVIL